MEAHTPTESEISDLLEGSYDFLSSTDADLATVNEERPDSTAQAAARPEKASIGSTPPDLVLVSADVAAFCDQDDFVVLENGVPVPCAYHTPATTLLYLGAIILVKSEA